MKFFFLVFTTLIVFVSSLYGGWAPDFLIIGAQKSGTTALYHFLNQHPLVVKKMDETHYFDHNFDKTLEWYRNQFPERPKEGYLIGDKSPYYLFHPLVPERVHSLYPDVKILVILRNPVDRAYSQYWHNIRNKVETLTFEEVIEQEPERLKGEFEKLISDPTYKSYNYQKFSYQERGKYIEQLKRWLNYFKPEQILVITNDELRNKPKKTMGKVFDFLKIHRLGELKPYIEGHEPYPQMDLQLRQKLEDKFRPYNEELERLLQRTFLW